MRIETYKTENGENNVRIWNTAGTTNDLVAEVYQTTAWGIRTGKEDIHAQIFIDAIDVFNKFNKEPLEMLNEINILKSKIQDLEDEINELKEQ